MPIPLLTDSFCVHCNKKGHPTYGRAVKVALRTSVKYGKGIRIYFCRQSKTYHTTSMKLW